MPDENALNHIMMDEIIKIETRATEKIQIVKYARKFFDRNYEHIKEVYIDQKDSDDQLFLRVRSNIEQIISLSKPNRSLSLHPDTEPSKLGLLSEWVTWAGSDGCELGYKGMLNERGREIVDDWKKYREMPTRDQY